MQFFLTPDFYYLAERELCYPSIRLCTKVNGIPVCKKAKVWKRSNFKKDATSWEVISPLTTWKGRRNCWFEIFEYPNYSEQGEHKTIKPGSYETITWNIRSLRIKNMTSTNL